MMQPERRTAGASPKTLIEIALARMCFFAALACALPTTAVAAPSVFVQSEQGSAFWNSGKTVGRILDKQAGPVTTKALTQFIAGARTYFPYEICALSSATRDSYVGVDKAAAEELLAYDGNNAPIYRTAATTPDGRQVIAQAVLFESCGGDIKGAAVLTYDARTGAVLMFEEVTDSEKSHWFAFLSPNTDKSDSLLFTYSACLECGSSTAVYYDVTRKKIYTEYNGH